MPDILAMAGAFGDIVVAVVLLGILAIVFFASRARVLPRASLPVAIGAVAALIGVRIFSRHLADAYRKEIEEAKKRIAERDEKIRSLEVKHEAARREAAAARAALEDQIRASKEAALLLEEKDRKAREELGRASVEEIDRRFEESRRRLREIEGEGAAVVRAGGAL